MKRKIIAIAGILTILTGALCSCTPGGQTSEVTYEADFTSIFSNPERGFHNRYEIINDKTVNPYIKSSEDIEGFEDDAADRTFKRAKDSGHTLIHSYIHLDLYRETDQLPQALLDNLSSGLDAIRDAGLKIDLRCAYTWEKPEVVPEARILGHIEQVNAVISQHADVIMYIQAGYLGNWGEWHEWHQTLKPVNKYYGEEDFPVRYRVVQKILETTPDSIPVAMRYPAHIKQILEEQTPDGATPLTDAQKDRLGYHNDSFMVSAGKDNDWGSYGVFGASVEQDRQWAYALKTSDGFNKLFGGECEFDGSLESGEAVFVDAYKLNLTELNYDYNQGQHKAWKVTKVPADGNDPEETIWERLQRKMGYRLRLVSAKFDKSVKVGGEYTFSFQIDNDGYAGIIRPRDIYFVLEGEDGSFDAIHLSDINPRAWVGGDIYEGPYDAEDVTIPIPDSLKEGEYKIGLWLPDANEELRGRPEYSIRFANEGIWNEGKGYNELGTLTVK